MPKEIMTPRERWQAVLNHQKPDRIPMFYRSTKEATEKLLRHLGCSIDNMMNRFHIDRIIVLEGKYIGSPITDNEDEYGCQFKNVEYATGTYRECVYNPLAKYHSVDEIEANYTWPTIDSWDFSHIPIQVENEDKHPIAGGESEPFLQYCRLRGQEQAYMDMMLNPEIVHYCLDRLFELCYQKIQRIYEQAQDKIMITCVAEDLGSQSSLLFSPNQIKEFLLPRMKRIMNLVHESSAKVMTHSDGAIREIIPDLIEIGMDMLDPIQWRCKDMEREALKKDFGDKIIFHGAMDNQFTLPFGSVKEVVQEVQSNISILGHDGGFILGPCHAIQAIGPTENVVAMYETGFNEGWM